MKPTNCNRGSEITRMSRALAFVAALAGVATNAATLADDVAKVGTCTIRVNGGALTSVQCFGATGATPGVLRFTGAAIDPNGQWEASWDYLGDLDPNGNASLAGSATITNKGTASASFDFQFEVPVCPFIKSGAKMGGACTLKLVTNANGGTISTPGGSSVFGALADAAVSARLFYGPFDMGSPSAGSAETLNAFGAPYPSYNVGTVEKSFGVRHELGLSDGDQVVLTSKLVLGAETSEFVACGERDQKAGTSAAALSPAAGTAPVAHVAQPPATSAPSAAPALPDAPTSSTVRRDEADEKRVTISAGPSGNGRPIAKKAPAPKKPPVAKKPPAKKRPPPRR